MRYLSCLTSSRNEIGPQQRPSEQIIGDTRVNTLKGFGVLAFLIGIAGCLRTALQSNPGVVLPQVLLRAHDLKRLVFLFPDRRDIQEGFRLPLALLRLMRLEQEYRRSADHG